jgi:hypothetical protein
MDITSYPFYNVVWAYPNCYLPVQSYCLTPVLAYECDATKTMEDFRPNGPSVERVRASSIQRSNRKKEKKNVRNIIPNISRKLINYLCSSRSGNVIRQIQPAVTLAELESFYEFAKRLKNSMSFYIGNKDLLRIWFGEGLVHVGNDDHNYRLMRILSKQYLEHECANSILLSRRIKPSLKADHLKYRRKILKLLYSRGSPSE